MRGATVGRGKEEPRSIQYIATLYTLSKADRRLALASRASTCTTQHQQLAYPIVREIEVFFVPLSVKAEKPCDREKIACVIFLFA